ncbi:MAG: hypothetical protein AAF292_17205 [Pseudomonadota bacterium]
MQEVINAVVIDNDAEDVLGVTTALSKNGISTLPIHYRDPTTALEMCRQVSAARPRIIITDIQLRDGGAEPTKSDLSAVAACLEKILEGTEGPYVILAWTTKPEALEGLKERVSKLFALREIRMPMYFDRICKDDCSVGEGEYSADEILARFQSHLESEASTRALMHWECSVLRAASDSLNTISILDPDTLPQSLKALAEAVAGSNLRGFEATAINEAFAYVLKDKLSLLSLEGEASERWDSVFQAAAGEVLEISKHQLNTLLHIDANPHEEVICPGDVWIVEKPQAGLLRYVGKKSDAQRLYDKLLNEFLTYTEHGHRLNQSVQEERDPELKSELAAHFRHLYEDPLRAAKEATQIAMVEISPACDFANQKKPLKSIALGVLIPSDAVDINVKLKDSDSNIRVKIMHENKEQILGFSAKYISALSEDLTKVENLNLTKTMRIRESLLQSWIHKFSAYNSRIGTVSFS